MIRVAYISNATGEVSTLLSGPDLGGMPEAITGYTAAMTDYMGTLPAYWNGTAVVAIPTRPSDAHEWDWSTKAWIVTLAGAKALAWERVKRARNQAQDAPFSWTNIDLDPPVTYVFDGDAPARDAIVKAAQSAEQASHNGSAWSRNWTLHDNSELAVDKWMMMDIYQAQDAAFAAVHATSRTLWAAIQAATSPEDALAIVWPT